MVAGEQGREARDEGRQVVLGDNACGLHGDQGGGLADRRGADHILEIVGGAHLGKAVQAAAVGGRIHLIGVLDGFDVSASAGPLLLKTVTIQGIGVGHRRSLEHLVGATEHLGLKPVIDAHDRLDALPDALDRVDRGPFGKPVVGLA